MICNCNFYTYFSIRDIIGNWDELSESMYQKKFFLEHLEKHNPCKQRYYCGYVNDTLVVGMIVYSLEINLFTFSGKKLQLKANIIGIPASVDASGVIGDQKYGDQLLTHILINEKGVILCLNYNYSDSVPDIIKMSTLPSLIFEKRDIDWSSFLLSIKHNYRRRIKVANLKFQNVTQTESECLTFTQAHYRQYLEVIEKTKTKLEVLSFDFFRHLPEPFRLYSFYHENELLTWHITARDEETYYFLFGGINYSLRDLYDSYFNNLIAILKEGFATDCRYVNLGQTAETSKNRLGAELVEKKMFLYHSHWGIRMILKALKGALTYKSKTRQSNIYKKAFPNFKKNETDENTFSKTIPP